MRLRLRYRGHWLSLVLTDERLKVSFDRGWSEAAMIEFRDKVVVMEEGETHEFLLDPGDQDSTAAIH